MKPFRFALIWATISVLIMAYFGIFEKQMALMEIQMQVGERTPEAQQFQEKMFEVMLKYMSLIILAIIPFSAFASRVVYFNKKYQVNRNFLKYTYSEHLILSTFIVAVSTAIGAVLNLIYAIFPALILYATVIALFINYIMYLWSFKGVFKDNWFLTSIKAGLVNFLAVFMVGFLAVVIAMIFAFLY
ncbi:MAG: hypothetical protein HRT74_00480 [Flavobacteriales bacterium]|nr:hypothetical protein [Flavobacteriales bacterium]